MSIVFSNIPGPKSPLIFDKSETKWMISCSPSLDEIGAALAIVSHNGVVKFNILADKCYMNHASDLLEIFEKNFERVMK